MAKTNENPEFPGMPSRYKLWSSESCEGDILIANGPKVLFCYSPTDRGMRNLAIVALTDAGCSGKEVAALFGLSEEHVSRLRTKVHSHGSSALIAPIGAPFKLTLRMQKEALRLSRSGSSGAEIARSLSVSEATISRLLARKRDEEVPECLFDDKDSEGAKFEESDPLGTDNTKEEETNKVESNQDSSSNPSDNIGNEVPAQPLEPDAIAPLANLGEVVVPSRYAGAMLLHPFFTRLGVNEILSSLPKSDARRYDARSLVIASAFAFAIGISSMEGTKHLVANDAGALIGAKTFPHLRTLRPRLKALAEASDPIKIQTAFAKAMLNADDHPPEVFYVDDHFVTYWGKQPVAKGYNVRRHLAEPGRDDTFVVDDSWRAICFSSGDPRGLSVTLPEVLGELGTIVGECRVMVGFDRGGSYPKVFNALAEANMDWVTWRRAPLVPPAVLPTHCLVEVNGKVKTLVLADELVELNNYEKGKVRQISCYEGDKVVFQILTSNTELDAALITHKMRSRWCIENTNKYLEDHQGIHWLATYDMDIKDNTTKVTNPARKEARAIVKAAQVAKVEATLALGECVDEEVTKNNQYRVSVAKHRSAIKTAKEDLLTAKAALKEVPAKLPANEINPEAKRAKPHLFPRALQMVCRLLAYNAELDLARSINAYLGDDDEYRATTRNLLHLGGRIAFGKRQITVTLDRPSAPRIARALAEFLEELAYGPPTHMASDQRPIVYRLDSTSD